MPKEIERKFLVASQAWRDLADGGTPLRQAYLAETEAAVVRVRIETSGRGFLTIKSAVAGMSRDEFEYTVPVADAEALIGLRRGSLVEKVRFRVAHGGRTWEVDVYSGENEGLVLAEIELGSEADTVDLPPWAGREVTGDRRYYASTLARSPFCSWSLEASATRSGP